MSNFTITFDNSSEYMDRFGNLHDITPQCMEWCVEEFTQASLNLTAQTMLLPLIGIAALIVSQIIKNRYDRLLHNPQLTKQNLDMTYNILINIAIYMQILLVIYVIFISK